MVQIRSLKQQGYMLVFVVFMIAILGLMASFLFHRDKIQQNVLMQNFWHVTLNNNMYVLQRYLQKHPAVVSNICSDPANSTIFSAPLLLKFECAQDSQSFKIMIHGEVAENRPFPIFLSRQFEVSK